MDVADDKEERKYAHSCNGTDEKHGTDKGTRQLQDDADDDWRHNPRQVTDKIEDATSKTYRISRRNVTDRTPDDSCHALSKKSNGHDDDNDVQRIGVIGSDNCHGTKETANDRRLTSPGQAIAVAKHPVRPITTQKHAHKGAYIWDNGINAGFQQGQVLRHDEVRRKPCQEEIHRTRISKLSNIDADELAVFE